MRNPQAFQMISNAMQNKNNPEELINQIIKNYTPEQKDQFRQKAKQFGLNDEQLKIIK